MKKIAIVVGHGPKKDLGAISIDGTTERDWNADLASKISAAIGARAEHRIIFRETEKQPPISAVNEYGATVAVELHLNAFNSRASGTEMIHAPKSLKGRLLAEKLQEAAVRVLELPNRGVKGPQAGGRGSAFLTKTRPPAVIVESFFIDNSGDLARGNARKQALAKAYADVLVAF